MKSELYGACLAATTALTPAMAQAEVTINWWHALGGELGELLEDVAEAFNDSQDDFRVGNVPFDVELRGVKGGVALSEP